MSFLDDLKSAGSAVLKQGTQAAGAQASSIINKVTGNATEVRSGNTSPTPDITAMAARAQDAVGSFMGGNIGGIALPLLLAGGLAAFLLLRKR